MPNQRQRLARKRLKQERPELFPLKEPTPPKDPNSKKKEKSKFKKKKATKNLEGDAKQKRSNLKRHPLRVPGLKPGDGCFICKGTDHIAKLCPERAQWEKNKTCLLCRQRGHTLKRCPNQGNESGEARLCYNCGENGHSLSNCPQPLQDGGTKYASCFICNEHGHLSKDCPKNTHGIYPKGGCCKICSGVTHLAKDCPEKQNQASGGRRSGYDIDPENRPNVTKLISGDDLEDDFDMEDQNGAGNNGNPSKSMLAKEDHTGTKKKPGPKVVNFAG